MKNQKSVIDKNIVLHDSTLRDGNHAIRHQLDYSDVSSYCKAAELAGITIIEVVKR